MIFYSVRRGYSCERERDRLIGYTEVYGILTFNDNVVNINPKNFKMKDAHHRAMRKPYPKAQVDLTNSQRDMRATDTQTYRHTHRRFLLYR